MRFLAIDTGSGTSTAAGEWVNDSFVLRAASDFDDQFGHAENIGIALRDVLASAGWDSDQQLVVVANQGPAGYTGLRVGLAAATTFAATRSAPLIGVSSLAAAAYRHFAKQSGVSECTVALEAKRNELFFQQFQRSADSPVPIAIAAPTLIPKSELPEPLPPSWTTQPPDAKIVAELGAQLWLRNPREIGVTAQYLRQPDVTPSLGKRVSG